MAQRHNSIRQPNTSPASWPSQPTEPDPMPPAIPGVSVQGSLQAPRPEPLRLLSQQRGQWQREQEREAQERVQQRERSEQQRREYLWRKQLDLRLERQRLDAEEQALQQAWDTLPRPASPLTRLIIALAVIIGIIALAAIYPMLLVPLIIILLIVVRVRRQRRGQFRQRNTWIEQERYRIQSRIAWIDARVASIAQEEQHLSFELLASGTAQEDDPER